MAQKGITRTNRRVLRNQVAQVLNRLYYQAGREWATLSSDGEATKREKNAAASVGQPEFVTGIIHKDHPVDGYEKGVSCNCG